MPGSVTYQCESRVEMEGGRVVDQCPSNRGASSSDLRFVGALTAPTVELPRDRALEDARERVTLHTVPCASFELANLRCFAEGSKASCSGVCDSPEVEDLILLGAYQTLLQAECSGEPATFTLPQTAWAQQCSAACRGQMINTSATDRTAQQIDSFECAP
jgi:hypothetical protein